MIDAATRLPRGDRPPCPLGHICLIAFAWNPKEKRPVVALFRAEDDAAETAGKLAALGFDTARLPVIVAARRSPPRPAASATTRSSPPAPAPFSRLRRSPRAPAFSSSARAPDGRPRPPAGGSARRRRRTPRSLRRRSWSVSRRARASSISPAGTASGRWRLRSARRHALETVEVYAAEAREAWRPDELGALFQARGRAALFPPLRRAGGGACGTRRGGHAFPGDETCLSFARRRGADRIVGGGEAIVAETPDEPALLGGAGCGVPASLLRLAPPL